MSKHTGLYGPALLSGLIPMVGTIAYQYFRNNNATLEANLNERFTAAETTLEANLDERITAAETTLKANLNERIAVAETRLSKDINKLSSISEQCQANCQEVLRTNEFYTL